MPTIKGNLMFVSSRAAQVSEVWVRAPRVRTHVEGVVTTGNDRFPVDGGEVSFSAVPGPAVLALISQGRAVDTIPILVGDASTQTLRQVVSAAKVADDATQREIEKLAAQAVELIDSSTENAKKAQDGAQRAETAASSAKQSESSAASSASGAKSSASAASSSASKAATSEQNAANSAGAAKTSENNALSSANAAKSSASSAAASETNAASSAREAKSDATLAAESQYKTAALYQDARNSAVAAADSASSAKSDADRAANIADGTSWDGDRLTVNGKTSPSLTGPKGDPGQDGKNGSSAWGDITGKPSTFPPSSHTHRAEDVADLKDFMLAITEVTEGKADKAHRHVSADITDTTNGAGRPEFGGRVLTPRARDGKLFYYSDPTEGIELANKAYVDREVGALSAQVPRGKPVEVVPAGLTGTGVRDWLRGKLVEYGTTYDTVVVLPFDLDTSQADDMASMFYNCWSLVSVPPMNTSNVTSMDSMFSNCSSLTAVPPMNTSNATNTGYMFSNCSSLISAEVRLYRANGTKPDNTSYMISGTQFTREPFYTPDGTPIN